MPTSDMLNAFLRSGEDRLLSGRPSVVIFMMSNIAWQNYEFVIQAVSSSSVMYSASM